MWRSCRVCRKGDDLFCFAPGNEEILPCGEIVFLFTLLNEYQSGYYSNIRLIRGSDNLLARGHECRQLRHSGRTASSLSLCFPLPLPGLYSD